MEDETKEEESHEERKSDPAKRSCFRCVDDAVVSDAVGGCCAASIDLVFRVTVVKAS